MSSKPLGLFFLILLTSPFWELGRPLMEVDDARYAEVPREMVVMGDWATPHLDGMDYVEKPPLWYWLAAASYKTFGVSEAASRLPLALLSLLGLWGVYWLGSWLDKPRTGLLAAVCLGTSALYFFLTHFITPDMPLTVFLLWTTAMILRTLLRPEDSAWATPAAWAFAGLAFLSKGLVALVFPAGWTLLCLALFPALRKGALSLFRPAGPLLFIGIAAPWFILMEHRHPGFLKVFFLEQHFQRFLTQKYNRSAPCYFFFLVLPAGLLPWTPAAVLGTLEAWRRRTSEPSGAALALWAGMILVFFSTSQSKLATYILPVFPHLCLLAARAVDGKDKKSFWGPACAGLLLGTLALAGGRWVGRKFCARPISEAIAAGYSEGDRIYTYGVYLHGIPFYTGRRVDKVVNWWGELHYAKRDPANADRFGGDEAIRELPLPGRKVFVVLRRREAAYFLTLNDPKKMRSFTPFGDWALAEF